MVASMTVVAFAAPNGFVSSVSGKPGPAIESFDPDDDDCTADLIITPYSERHDLPKPLLDIIEKAYKDIVNADDLADLSDALAKLVKDKKIDSENLAVSDLFDIHADGCDSHDGHEGHEIILEADSLKNFVGLIYINEDGEWELVTDAEVINNGKHLKFSVDSLSTFAIVVDTSDGPQTGDNTMIYVSFILMIVSAAALVVVLIKSKKQKA
jgi:hypothetical protein